jgi:hypothetical protein
MLERKQMKQTRRYGLLVAPMLHLCFCLLIQFSHTEGSWGWFPVFVVDLPFSFLLFGAERYFGGPLIEYGLLGTLWWFFLSWFLFRLFSDGFFSDRQNPIRSKWKRD